MKVPAANIKDTPFAAVRFTFVNVTPELAAEWLKHNFKNRKLKEDVLEKYITDVRNKAFLTTHECLAFDADGNLCDGQHRLHSIVRAKEPVLMVVSTGWPVNQGKRRTMDALNMGKNRSLADQLHLQHGLPIKEAGRAVQVCNAIAAASFGVGRISASTTDTVLAVYALYKNELTWLMQNTVTTYGVAQATVAACLVMARAVWADKTQDARNRLETGENLTRENPLLHLRNWLMGDGSREDKNVVRRATFHHLAAFVDGKSLPQIVVNSDLAYIRILKLHHVRLKQICAIYGKPLPEILAGLPPEKEANPKASATSDEAIAIGQSLSQIFSSTDLIARTDANAGQWLMTWHNKKWIEPAGVNQFKKTANFGKA